MLERTVVCPITLVEDWAGFIVDEDGATNTVVVVELITTTGVVLDCVSLVVVELSTMADVVLDCEGCITVVEV